MSMRRGALQIMEDLVRAWRDLGFEPWIKPVLFTEGSATTTDS